MKKSIKKISSLALAMLMAGSIMPMAFAADTDTEINQDTVQKQSDVKVSYEIKETYKVTFPSEVIIASDAIDADTKEVTFNIKLEDIAVASGNAVKVGLPRTLDLKNKVAQDEMISLKLGNAAEDYTGTEAGELTRSFGNNKGVQSDSFDVGMKLKDADQLNGKSSGTYEGNITVKVSVGPNA